MGFCDDVKGYRIYDPVKNRITTSRDVVILEKTKKEETVTVSIENTDSVGESIEESVVTLETRDQSSLSESEHLECDDVDMQEEEDRSIQVEGEGSSTQDIPCDVTQTAYERKEKRQRKKPSRYGYANMCTTPIGEDGMTYAEAISDPEKQQWLQAIAEELQSFEDNQV